MAKALWDIPEEVLRYGIDLFAEGTDALRKKLQCPTNQLIGIFSSTQR